MICADYLVDETETNRMGGPCGMYDGYINKEDLNSFSIKKEITGGNLKAGRRIIWEWILKK
jgi:hypothetical protein